MKVKKLIKDISITILILSMSFALSLLFKDVLHLEEHITTLFVFAVFLISLVTDGYVYGIVGAVIGVLSVNFAFVFPYFSFAVDFPEDAFSALVMICLSLITSTLTTRLKRWEAIKSEGEMEKMKANLLRAVSHDIRTPLTTIYASSSVVLESYNNLTDEQKLVMIRGIREDSDWLIRMVENLLSVTKIDGGKLKLIKTPIVLDELIDAVLLKFKKRYPDIKPIINLPQEIVIIPMDAILVEQVLINLLENAVHHAKEMTKLTVSVWVREDKAYFEIIDDGCGISRDKLDHIFSGKLGYTGEQNDSQGRNAGIGLSVCASIVKAHGGEVFAENNPDRGAKFGFYLLTKEESVEQ